MPQQPMSGNGSMDDASADIRPQPSSAAGSKELTEELELLEDLETKLGNERLVNKQFGVRHETMLTDERSDGYHSAAAQMPVKYDYEAEGDADFEARIASTFGGHSDQLVVQQTSDFIQWPVPDYTKQPASDLCSTERPTDFCYDTEYMSEQHLASSSEQGSNSQQPATSYSTEQPMPYFIEKPAPYFTAQQVSNLAQHQAFIATKQPSYPTQHQAFNTTKLPSYTTKQPSYPTQHQAFGSPKLTSYATQQQASDFIKQQAFDSTNQVPFFTNQAPSNSTEQLAPCLTNQPAFNATNQSSYNDDLATSVLVSVAKHNTLAAASPHDFNTSATVGSANMLAGSAAAQAPNGSCGLAEARAALESFYTAGVAAATAASTLGGGNTLQVMNCTEWLAKQQAHEAEQTAELQAFNVPTHTNNELGGGLPPAPHAATALAGPNREELTHRSGLITGCKTFEELVTLLHDSPFGPESALQHTAKLLRATPRLPSAQTRVAELLRVAQGWLPHLSPHCLVNALCLMRKLRKLCPCLGGPREFAFSVFVAELLTCAQDKLPLFKPTNLANTAWTLAILDHRNDEFERALLLTAKDKQRSFDPDAATMMATAVAATGRRGLSGYFMSDLMLAIYPSLHNFSVQNLTKMLASVVNFSHSAVDGRLFKLEGALLQLLDADGGRPFMTVHEPFFTALLAQATLQLPNFKNAHLVDILEALAVAASMHHFNPVFVHALVEQACLKVAGFVTAHVLCFRTALLEITSVMRNTHTTRPFEFPEFVRALLTRDKWALFWLHLGTLCSCRDASSPAALAHSSLVGERGRECGRVRGTAC
ncbi:hypothetical protein FOA52_014144 [Chlamydomonas sp. UWO 241]|nr:hypothetical protein FOA52_014144 [Chlamydomonas sp. UWO 241]